MKKKVLICMLALALASTVTACGKEEQAEKKVSTQQEKDSRKDQKKEAEKDTAKKDSSEVLTAGEVDYYNEIKDSNYISAVLFDPSKDKAEEGMEQAVVCVVNLGENVAEAAKNGFRKSVTTRNTRYEYGVGTENNMAYLGICSDKLSDGSFEIAGIESLHEDDYMLTTSQIYSATKIEKEEKQNEYYVYAEDGSWRTPVQQEEISNIYLKIGETEEENIFARMYLDQPVPGNGNLQADIGAKKDSNAYKNSILLLNDMDDLTSVENTYGPEIALEDTVFYQDLVAAVISDSYGLNLKDKDSFLHLDMNYIKYRGYDSDNSLVGIDFFCNPVELRYETAEEELGETSFAYTDADGNEYEYFAEEESQCIYVFKNKEFQGALREQHVNGHEKDSLFGYLAVIFNTRE